MWCDRYFLLSYYFFSITCTLYIAFAKFSAESRAIISDYICYYHIFNFKQHNSQACPFVNCINVKQPASRLTAIVLYIVCRSTSSTRGTSFDRLPTRAINLFLFTKNNVCLKISNSL